MNGRDELNNKYFAWMCDTVRDPNLRRSYKKLLKCLYYYPFEYRDPMDSNREVDGFDLRYRFARENGYPDWEVAAYLDKGPCMILEMMVALAIRVEEHIMEDPDLGDRTYRWFWEMVDSLGLMDMTDENFDEDYVEEVIDRFSAKRYKRNGKGGLFTVRHTNRDMRQYDIWYQMCMYLNEIV